MKMPTRFITVFFVLTVISALAFYSLHLHYQLETALADRIQLEQLADTRRIEITDLQRQLDELRHIGKPEQQPPAPEAAKIAYLTFDDGPTHNTPLVLDILKQYGVKATFFVNANTSDFGREMYQRIVAEGHVLGNHGYSHDYAQIYQSLETYWNNVKLLDDFLHGVTGQRPRLTRFPGGSRSSMAEKYGHSELMNLLIGKVQTEGFEYFDWNVSSLDATSVTPDKQVIVDGVMNGVRGKDRAIVLMHDGYTKGTTVEALPTIIEQLRSQGYVFRVLSTDSFNYQFSR